MFPLSRKGMRNPSVLEIRPVSANYRQGGDLFVGYNVLGLALSLRGYTTPEALKVNV